MRRFSKELLADFNIRRTIKQKNNFYKKICDKFYDSGYEVFEERKFSGRNIYIGDIKKADIIFAARYDTKPTLPFKNFIFPKNKKLTYFYYFLVFSVMNIISLFLEYCYFWITESMNGSLICYFISMAIMLLWYVFGFSFSGADDNTSSVMALCESILSFSPEVLKKKNVAFVFFDKSFKTDKTVIELTKIGVGNNILFMCSKELRDDNALTDKLISYIENHENKANNVTILEKTSYKSRFDKTMLVSSFLSTKKGLLYSKNSRTLWDNKIDETNIELISKFITNIISGK